MSFAINYTESALEDIAYFKKYERVLIFDAIDQQLTHQPFVEVRNRKPLDPNELGSWELRIGKYRVFYDTDTESNTVIVRVVGWKEHNTLFIRGKEYKL